MLEEASQDYIYCDSCELAIKNKRYADHRRKCKGEVLEEPVSLPIAMPAPAVSDKIRCSICEKTMSLDQFKYHEFFCTEPMAPCQFCKRQIYVFRLDSHQSNCSANQESESTRQQKIALLLKRYFSVVHGVELPAQLSADAYQLLLNEVFPALQKMQKEKGLRSKEIDMIEAKQFEREQMEMCSICQDSIFKGEITMTLQCKHIFHQECARLALKHSPLCPNCRFQIKPRKA